MLSNSCLVLLVVVKQQLEEISRNHVPSLFAAYVDAPKINTTFGGEFGVLIGALSSQRF